MVEIYGEACSYRIGTLAGLWLADATNRSLEKAAGCGWNRWSVTSNWYALNGSLVDEQPSIEEKEVVTLQVSVIDRKAIEGHCIPSESRKMTVSIFAETLRNFSGFFHPRLVGLVARGS